METNSNISYQEIINIVMDRKSFETESFKYVELWNDHKATDSGFNRNLIYPIAIFDKKAVGLWHSK